MRGMWLAWVLVALPAWGQETLSLQDVLSARTLAMGGAFRATGIGADSVDGNPAAMSLYKLYQVDAQGGWDVGTKDAYWGSAVRDSATSEVAGGVSYHMVWSGRGAARQMTNLSTLSIGVPLSDSLSIGASGHYLVRPGPNAADAVTMDAGLAMKIFEGLNLGVSAHDLINTYHPELPRFYSAGLSFMTGIFNAAADVTATFSGGFHPAVHGGLEFLLEGTFALRAGYAIDTATHSQQVSGGLGLEAEGSGVDLSYRHELTGASRLLILTVRTQL